MNHIEKLNLNIITLPHYPPVKDRAALAAIPNHLLIIISPPIDSKWQRKALKQHKLLAMSYKHYQHILDILEQYPSASYSDLYPLIYEKTGLLLNT